MRRSQGNGVRRLARRGTVALVIAAAFLIPPFEGRADDGNPWSSGAAKTLLQWSSGNSFGGGAPLDEPLVSDRPDFTEASTTVGRGVVQLEMGYTFFEDREGASATRLHTYPELLVRAGVLADWLELRIGWTMLGLHETDGVTSTRATGSDDLLLGFKLALTPQEGILPELAFIPQTVVPLGDLGAPTGDLLPGGVLIYGWELNDYFSTAGQSQLNRRIDDGTLRTYWEFSQSWTVGISLTEQLGSYVEWFTLVPDGADTATTEHFFDGGFTYLVTNDLQLDVRAGVAATRTAPDYFVGVGIVVRL